MIYLLFFLLFISIMILTILYLSVRVIAKNYQTKEGKKKVKKWTLDTLFLYHLASVLIAAGYMVVYNSKLSFDFQIWTIVYVFYCVVFLSLIIDFVNDRWEQAINNSDESDPVGDYFKSKK